MRNTENLCFSSFQDNSGRNKVKTFMILVRYEDLLMIVSQKSEYPIVDTNNNKIFVGIRIMQIL